MNAAEYRAAAERIVTKDTISYGSIAPDRFRKAEILAQLAVSAAISEATEVRTSMPQDRYQMNADYEAIDSAEYAQFNTSMDALDAERNQH
ncbi:hypothetical protein [Streptomyces sp. NPDC088115]|uniref:hypothetical protein n=1 Tax=Streptomyces sp. NPDC088115 TaxID=3365824 RepID=UPI00381E5CD1